MAATQTAAAKAAAAKAAQKAATAEATGDPVVIEVHGLALTMPLQVPFSVIQYAVDEPTPPQMFGMLRELLGPKQTQQVLDAGLSLEQGLEVLREVMVASGVTAGESSASESS